MMGAAIAGLSAVIFGVPGLVVGLFFAFVYYQFARR